jgi:serine/threonine protein kinase
MPENQQSSVEQELTTTSGEIQPAPRRKTHEMPAELAEFAANYEVQGLIGEGGMSAVYKAQHKALNKPMAIKMLHAHLVRDVVQRKRFEQEAQALFLLEHRNIVKLRDFGSTENGKPYLIMDFLKGKPLSEILKEGGPLPVNRALGLFLQMCDALEHAHQKSIIHRDIKPSNIVLVEDDDDEDCVRIVDFGIAKLAHDEINPGLTQTGDVFGSPLYMSPEQCLGHKLDSRSDMYALGCVMYEVLSGKPPLAGETALSTIHKHTSEMPKPLQVPNCDPRLRERLDEIIFKTLEKDPEKRYQTMGALHADLKELAGDTGYRKKTGYYVRYARAHRVAINNIKKHPIRFLSVMTVLTATLSYGIYSFLDSGESLLRSPETLNYELDWNWLAKPVDQPPIDFMDKLRQARFLVVNASNRLGREDDHVKEMQRKLAEQALRYGFWDEGIDHLVEARAGYKGDDPNIADIDQNLGDIYVQKKEWDKAASSYERAMLAYKNLFASADNSESIAKLKHAWTLLRTPERRITAALSEFESISALRLPDTKFEGTMAKSGVADCQLGLAEAAEKDPRKRDEMISDARGGYTVAANLWNQWSKHDAMLCGVRVADTYILEGKLQEACKQYAEVMKHLDVFNDEEIAKIEANYARLLWRNFNLVEALRVFDQSKETARRASQHGNEQNNLRFDPGRSAF